MRAFLACLFLLVPATARASEIPDERSSKPWQLTVYSGIATRDNTSQIFLHGQFHPDSTQLGIAINRILADMGSGFSLEGEASVATFLSKSDETSFDLGLGVRYRFHVFENPTSLAMVTGPSFADQPPVIATGSWHGKPINFKRNAWLNYVGAEVATAIASDWNAVLRYYHRSGAFGLFQPNADEGSTFAIGLQYRF